MKNKQVIVVMFVLILLLITGCNKNNIQFETAKGDVMKNYANFYAEIYRVSRSTFDSFLVNPSIDIINSDNPEKYNCSNGVQWHIRQGAVLFEINQSLIDFVGDKTKIKNYLSQNGINSDVDSAVIIDTPNVPLTIWVKTDQENVFITINEQIEDEMYVYRCYTSSGYNEKYSCVYASLNVKGEIITNNARVKLYSNYADIPFISVLESLGATLTWETDGKITIAFNEKFYYLDVKSCELYEVGNKTENILNQTDGGPMFVYSVEQELMVDSHTLALVLKAMGENITINCDRTNRTVTIK